MLCVHIGHYFYIGFGVSNATDCQEGQETVSLPSQSSPCAHSSPRSQGSQGSQQQAVQNVSNFRM